MYSPPTVAFALSHPRCRTEDIESILPGGRPGGGAPARWQQTSWNSQEPDGQMDAADGSSPEDLKHTDTEEPLNVHWWRVEGLLCLGGSGLTPAWTSPRVPGGSLRHRYNGRSITQYRVFVPSFF